MLCATDPVAVVALLKELGASPIITVQIQGESLLNDGTAIVLYLVAYDIVCGKEYDAADIAEFLIKKAMMAWALGLFIGYFFFSWIRAAADKLDHSSGIIQITLTLSAAYWSFIFVEGVLHLSGVLATVACSLVLAHHMWPYIVSEHSMHDCWHTFESLGNMIVFFLAGAKTGQIFVDVDAIDILNLLIIYVFLVFLRGALMFASRPVLQRLSADRMAVSWQDATLMTWGGLRGAVGLALALAVNNDLAPDVNTGVKKISAKDGERILFFVAGIAFLTTLVNATTAPALVSKLGITALPQARLTLLKMFHSQLVGWAEGSNHPPEVVAALKHMLHEASHHIDHQKVSKTGPSSSRSSGQVAPAEIAHGQADAACQQNPALIAELAQAKAAYDAIENDEIHKGLIGEELDDNLLGKTDDMIALISKQYVDEGMAKVVNEIFLTLVYNNYWKLIEEGLIRPGSVELEVCLTACRVSLSPFRADLVDFSYVQTQLETHPDFSDLGDEAGLDADMKDMAPGALATIVASWQFNIAVGLAILINTMQVAAEEIWRDPCNPDINNHVAWLIADAFFTIFFLVEMITKMGAMKLKYFSSAWNKFDFFLVWVGVFGLVMSIVTHGKEAELAGKTRIIRVARVLRTLRFLRIFRLFHARMSGDKHISLELAREFKKVTVLTCFVRAHVMAQLDLVKYFGGNGKLDEANESEIARCILQSQVVTYKALCLIAATQEHMGGTVYTELENLYSRKHITEGLSKWVLQAHKDGALSATEAHAILHPLNHMVAECLALLSERAEGMMESEECIKERKRLSESEKHGHHGEGKGDSEVKAIEKGETSASPVTTSKEEVAEASPSPPDTSIGEPPKLDA
jgi:NhaP-type Na+/H+ or K+/H+ antiporter